MAGRRIAGARAVREGDADSHHYGASEADPRGPARDAAMRVLLLGALGDPHYDRVWDFLAQRTALSGAQGAWGAPSPAAAPDWSGASMVRPRAHCTAPAARPDRPPLAPNFPPGPTQGAR